MGWTGLTLSKLNNSDIDVASEIRKYLEGYNEKVIAAELINDVVYVAISNTDTLHGSEIRGFVFLTQLDGDVLYFNEICEEAGPFAYECPNKILDILTPTNEECALKWRSLCREFNSKKVSG